MKKLVWGLVIATLVLPLGFFAVGGKQGVMLLFLRQVH